MLKRVTALALILFATAFGTLRSQTVTVADLMPLTVGQYVYYNQYDTTTSGSTPIKSNGYYEALQTGLSFQGETGVILVRDSLGAGDPYGAHLLHYHFTPSGDLQVFADTALMNDILPSSLAAGVKNPPNRWIDQYKLTAGTNVVYPIDTINTTYTSSGQTASVKITFSGEYIGTENITVGSKNFPEAYHFELVAKLAITDIVPLGTLTLTESDWLAKGVGVIRTSLPIDSTKLAVVNTEVSAGGRDKEMISYGNVSSLVSQVQHSTPYIHIYPDPASTEATFTFDRSARQIFLFNPLGELVRSFDIPSQSGIALLWLEDVPNGMYFARVNFVDGTSKSTEMIVQH